MLFLFVWSFVVVVSFGFVLKVILIYIPVFDNACFSQVEEG